MPEHRPVAIGGRLLCRACFQDGVQRPNHPDHPNSPYCTEHYDEARKRAKREAAKRRRAKRKDVETAAANGSHVSRTQSGAVVLDGEAAAQLVDDLTAWAARLSDGSEALRHAVPNQNRMLERVISDIGDLPVDIRRWVTSLSSTR